MSARAERLVKHGFVTVQEAQKFLGIGKTSMYRLIASKTISHATFCGRIVIPRCALEEYAATRLIIGNVA